MSTTVAMSNSGEAIAAVGNHSSNSNVSITTTTTTSKPTAFVPGPDWTLLAQGAEARVWKTSAAHPPLVVVDNAATGQNSKSDDTTDAAATTTKMLSNNSNVIYICKERFPKRYRHPVLDDRLTKLRCRMEARILNKCSKTPGLDVPKVVSVVRNKNDSSSSSALLYLEYIHGRTVREYLDDLQRDDCATNTTGDGNNSDAGQKPLEEPLANLATNIGTALARLHAAGIIHGDLTTSNMMVRNHDTNQHDSNNGTATTTTTDDDATTSSNIPNNIVLIDFGLAKNTAATEDKAVDLYVLERALQSTHAHLTPTSFWTTILAVYATEETRLLAATNTNTKNKPKANKSKHYQDTLTRLDQVRQRGRKRECFG